jgi:arylsulfatase A-like enzyme
LTLDGVSFLPVLRGTGALPARALFWHYPHYGNQGGAPGGAVRQGDFKLIEWYEDGRRELFNLRDDLGEANNLAAKMPGKADELAAQLAAWRREVGAVMPTPNSNYDPAKPSGRLPPAAAPGAGKAKQK